LTWTNNEPDHCTIIGSHRCKRLWNAALAWYARDCLATLRRHRQGKAIVEDDEAATALVDLEGSGEQLHWLCVNASLEFEYTRRCLIAWLADSLEPMG
jgi:hypothetical protein